MKSILLRKAVLCCFLCCITFGIKAQRLSFRDSVSPTIHTNYLALQVGIGSMILRDQNISPLFNQGTAFSGGLRYEWFQPKWFHNIDFHVNYGMLSSREPLSKLPQNIPITQAIGIHLATTNLWKTPWIKNKNWLLEVGGAFKLDPIGRINSDLFNNSFSGYFFMNVMGSAKIIWDLTREKSYYKTKKNGKKKLKTARQRKLSVQADVGALNFNFMPGFTNVYMPAYNGNSVNTLSQSLSQYKFKMNGWRFDLQIDFLMLHTTGNGHKIGLIWSAMHAPGVYKPLDFGNIQVQYSLMINQKK